MLDTESWAKGMWGAHNPLVFYHEASYGPQLYRINNNNRMCLLEEIYCQALHQECQFLQMEKQVNFSGDRKREKASIGSQKIICINLV